MKCSADELQVNSSNLYPIMTPESQGLMPTPDLETTVSLSEALPGKEDPSLPSRESGKDWVTLCQAPKAVCPTVLIE